MIHPRDILREVFGFAGYRPGQREVLSALWRHRAALAVFPTGAGKSLCYQLPATMLDGLTLVVSPLIALMKDQVDFLRERGIAAARLDSSLSSDEARAVNSAIRNGNLKVLFVAPERFANELFLAEIRRAKIALFAVDEAHCISEWGHNFRPDYLTLARTCRSIGSERVLALTATATPEVVTDVCRAFGIPAEAAIVTGFYRPNLRLLTTPVRADERDAMLLERLRTRQPGSAIVYVTLQRTAEQVAWFLTASGVAAQPYHAGMDAERRSAVQDWWTASDNGIVVATIAFGMGIDKSAVRYVYHYNLPKSLESYSQEVGRAGRDGQPAIVEMFVCPDDVPTLENFVYGDTPTPESVRSLVEHVLSQEGTFEVAFSRWSVEYDMRTVVLDTALTYLELMDAAVRGTPRYAVYKIALTKSVDEIRAALPGAEGRLASDLVRHCKAGTSGRARWRTVDAAEVAVALGTERQRVVRCLEQLRDEGFIEMRAEEVHHVFTVETPANFDPDAVASELVERFTRKEAAEIERVQQVLGLATHDGCQVNALVGHFGERRDEPCGHCSWCETRATLRLHAPRHRQSLRSRVSLRELRALVREHPEALGHPRQIARFLCGLTSPATTWAKLRLNPLFGCAEGYPFADVLAWTEAAVNVRHTATRGARHP